MTTSSTGPRSRLDKPLSCPPQHMSQSIYLSKFLNHQPTCPVRPRARPSRHRSHHTAQHTSQTTCHFQTLATCFILFLKMCNWYPADRTCGQWWFHCEVRACDSHLVFSLPVLSKINKQKFPQFRPPRASST